MGSQNAGQGVTAWKTVSSTCLDVKERPKNSRRKVGTTHSYVRRPLYIS